MHLHVYRVYNVTCSCGKCYVRETVRLVLTRTKNILSQLRVMNSEISAIATHAVEFDKINILASPFKLNIKKEKYLNM